MNVSNDAISRMERGKTVPTVLRLLELADIFQCEVADLLTESSRRSLDQAIMLDKLLSSLSSDDRLQLLNLIEAMVKWKQTPPSL